MRDKLIEGDPFSTAGDSAEAARRAAYEEFVSKLNALLTGKVPFTLVLSDPMANTCVPVSRLELAGNDGVSHPNAGAFAAVGFTLPLHLSPIRVSRTKSTSGPTTRI